MAALIIGGHYALVGGRALLVNGSAGSGGSGGSSGGSSGGTSGLTSVNLIGGGQSNAGYAETADGALLAMAEAVAFYLGATSQAVYSVWGGGGTEVSGIGIAETGTYGADGISFLTGGATTAALALAAGLGNAGTGYMSYLAGLTSGQRSALSACILYWGETDSVEYAQATKAVYKAYCQNWMSVVRAAIGKTAAQFPFLWFGPPYGYVNGSATVREVWAELAADPAQNVIWLVQQTYDTISRNDSWNPSTGVASGGNTDGGHRSAIDNVALFQRNAIAVARAIVAANGIANTVIPSALGTGLGPQITTAHLVGNMVTLTITHDAGTDLAVPLLASQGVGFSVMDGGTIASPGNIIKATACVRVNAFTLSLTLASTPVNAAAACRLMYPWPGTVWSVQPDVEIGRGCAVTDNFASVTKPTGFDINAVLGTGWGANMPLRSPVTVTGTGPSASAEYGLACS